MRKWIASGLLRKILLALLLVSLVPLGIIARFALQSYEVTREEVVSQSKRALDEEAFDGLEDHTLALANSIALFLEDRESDLYVLADLPRTEDAYLAFASGKRSELWTVVEGAEGETLQKRWEMPLYREVAYIDSSGREVLKVVNQCADYPFDCEAAISRDLADVSDPANTVLHGETYFSETLALDEGQIYVGPALGEYVPYEEAYAGAQNRTGQRYRGIMRFAMPVYQGRQRVGIVVLALETLHLIELTAHVAPASAELQAEIDPREADFAYIIDPAGWAISHPRHFNITGVDENGERVPPISQANRDDPDNLYRPGNFFEMGFIDPVFPALMEANQRGESGTVTAEPLGREARAISYATIPYYGGSYEEPAGFGLVVLSTDGARFSLEADLLGTQIGNRINDLSSRMQILGGATFVVVFALALMLARDIAFPILKLTETAREIEEGHWEEADLEELAGEKGNDEVSRLTRVFASMAKEVRQREAQLKKRVQELEIVIVQQKVEEQVSEITESEYFKNLSEKAQLMRDQRQRHADSEAEEEEGKSKA